MAAAKALSVLLVCLVQLSTSFTACSSIHGIRQSTSSFLSLTINDDSIGMTDHSPVLSRRSLMQSTLLAPLGAAVLQSLPAQAATRVPLEELLYKILRVREATQQESRLINSGKFKDVQRANVKLAVKFMLENYRLADQFVQASTYIEDSSKRLEAAQVGQSAVQNLYTILEYFDSSDVENIKVR
ncbi:hypothetical protein MPSEU_000387300 [Mayamaea pseudoterrestris]|nr:hypothetical protein MPSEU_000387300 [Mayamaea pseudoterrestris]